MGEDYNKKRIAAFERFDRVIAIFDDVEILVRDKDGFSLNVSVDKASSLMNYVDIVALAIEQTDFSNIDRKYSPDGLSCRLAFTLKR